MLSALALAACSENPPVSQSETSTVEKQPSFAVNYEKFELDNGLEVVFHKDTSDPVTAVALTFHVGSAREIENRTGFAHLFEHLLFLESENLGKGGLDKMSSRIGGSGANGSTSRDRTNYFQTVPNDALEKMIWAEADKMGFFINTVTDAVLAKEKQVVKNEKRQSVDNRPYGHANYVVDKNMYPADHPYNWQVIGSLEDLQNATLQDVKDFYNKWYVPNNATLVIAGDFDFAQAKAWVHKYFDEIPRGEEIAPLTDRPAKLTATVKRYYEDNFAQLPELRLVWPGVDLYHKDAYALDILTRLLADGKTAPLTKVVVEEKELAAGVNMFNRNSEIAGELYLITRAYPGTSLDEVNAAIQQAFSRFEQNGISDEDLTRVKAGIETRFYNGLSSVLGKAFELAQYNIFAGDPGYINEELDKSLAVTKDDIMRVYNQYIKGQAFIATSFVPKGQAELALSGSTPAQVVEEKIVTAGEGEAFTIPEDSGYERTVSKFDRSAEPPYGELPQPAVPNVWQDKLDNGLDLYGIENNELPLVQFELTFQGGLMLEDPAKVGVASLLATMLEKGTATKTAEELENALDLLGTQIGVYSGRQSLTISGTMLARNYAATMALVKEMLLTPRWDEREFALAKQSTLSVIAEQSANPNSIADNQIFTLLYGKDHILAHNPLGTAASVEAITLADLKQYYSQYITPSVADFLVVGAVDTNTVKASLASLNNDWPARAVTLPALSLPARPEQSTVYFYDVPGAKQSVLRFGYLAMAETDADFYPATIMNYKLGGGGFASRLMQSLREGKGYTYGIYSRFNGTDIPGPFLIESGVRTNVTFESAALVKEIMAEYPATFSDDDLTNTKSYFIKSAARQFETAEAKISMLENISLYGWGADYVKQRQELVQNITVDDVQKLAKQYANPNAMIWLVVGDAESQLSRLQQLGFGQPVLLNPAQTIAE
ncbi:peptidase M16 [Alteromonas lipolytica]|uniref:Peptidase M16 n=2 Tax=Alteromonas lipolytica TaxID=1856405 RepID=A0A1E8FID6_9ALTE|nr:peptidase M16 [Alteromonas lipolytica]